MSNATRGATTRTRFSSRPFYTTVFLLTLIATYALFVRGPTKEEPTLLARSGEDCRLIHTAKDKCAFVKRNCHDAEAGLIKYLAFYYCHLGNAQPFAFVILVLWLGLLFSTIGIAASDFFSVNLSTIATILGLSESLAGVTFLAFGNGSPDVFSTFAAMSSNSGSMAIGELIGAAGFITAVVAGSMALVREFKVSRKTFVRDIFFFIAAVSFAMGFLSDGQLHLWECGVMIAFYMFYVVVVVGWHAVSKRRKAKRTKEALSRGHFYVSSGDRGNEELEPYRDNPDDEDTTPGERQRHSAVDIGLLERAPKIETGGGNDDEDNDRNQQVTTEMTNSMRVNRPRGRRTTTTTITPIRPSLVGALEFRSVLSSLQEEGNVRLRPIHHGRSSSTDLMQNGRGISRASHSVEIIPTTGKGPSVVVRDRALSSGAILDEVDADLTPPSGRGRGRARDRGRAHSPNTIGGKLAPPPADQFGGIHAEGSAVDDASPNAPPQLHRLSIPSPQGSERSSPTLSPFPAFSESPMLVTENHPQHTPQLILPPPAEQQDSLFPIIIRSENPKPSRWWPYQLFPPPHVILNTLFPTLQGWRSKNIWDKFVSIISIPSIFFLVITLPVVETETPSDESDEDVVDEHVTGPLGNAPAAVSIEHGASLEPETEWQRYRRRAKSATSSRSHSPSHTPSHTPSLISIEPPTDEHESGQMPAFASTDIRIPRPTSEIGQGSSILDEEEHGWNRWLLILQTFTGPLFCVLIVWANMAEDLSEPLSVLWKVMLISVSFSLVLLGAILLTTSPDTRPKYHYLFCFLGFCIAIAWISTIANEVVGVLKAFGVILDISEAILGLTVFAVGNSVGDLVADVTVARLGYPVMALSACFGGPLLNILLGIGLGGAFQTVNAAKKQKLKHPNRPIEYRPYRIQVSGTLMISAITLLVTLLALLVVVPMNRWTMSRKIGWGLIGLWSVSTVANLALEITGLWQDIA
ncbi:Sodium/calcium exchanger protein-domain-containing protein [Hypoxylon sp. FL1284]|nr:Sodium/calcium exchanger protein-domain-containing protein [Hypoxylon sp. FL1284]